MEQGLFSLIVDFICNHFELMIYINAGFAVLFLSVFIAVQLHFVSLKRIFFSTFRGALYVLIISGQLAMFVIMGYLYWKNYRKQAPDLDIAEVVRPTTNWVSGDERVYFIEGNLLRSIKISGKGSEEVIRADAPIREFHFSADGKLLLVLSKESLYLIDRATKERRKIDSLIQDDRLGENLSEPINGAIGGVQWSPDSRKFIYEVARWSPYGMQDNVYVYSMDDRSKRTVKSPTRRISSLYWGITGDDLYYLHHDAQDTSVHSSAFEVNVFRIPMATLTPELVTQIPFDKASAPVENLKPRGINLYLGGGRFSFGRNPHEDDMVSSTGALVGIDEHDYMYYVRNKWFRKRLFRISRELSSSTFPRHQYKGGDLTVDCIRWLPGGRYVIMEHKYWGVLILEPLTGRAGVLLPTNGHTFGWYYPNEA